MVNNESIDKPSINPQIKIGSKRELLEIFSDFDTAMNIDSKPKDPFNSDVIKFLIIRIHPNREMTPF